MFEQEVRERVAMNGGFCNTHAHLTRALTVNSENLSTAKLLLQEKWRLVQELKKNTSVDGICYRLKKVIDMQINQGITSLLTFLDVDEYSQTKDLEAFKKVKEMYRGKIKIFSANQTLSGVLEKDANKWFSVGAEQCDFIGSLPAKDKGKESDHLDVVFKTAKGVSRNFIKPVHIHCDQNNTSREKETELILDKIVEHGMEGKVTLVHCISLNCHPKEYRNMIYERIAKTNTNVICCPKIWLDAPRSEELTPTHNSITPVDEMLQHDINVGIGTDNISDILGPFNNGDMFDEVKTLALCLRLYQMDTLVQLATTNGRKILYGE